MQKEAGKMKGEDQKETSKVEDFETADLCLVLSR
jgi:hypothetical protein